jgi:tetratricopeptide (TPR) repeat protein
LRLGLFERCGDHAAANEVADLKDRHNWTRALELESHVLEQQHREHGDRHPATLQSAYSVAQIYLGCKRFDDADEYIAWVRRDAPPALGASDPFVMRAAALAAAVMFERGRVRAAAELASAVVSAQAIRLGGEHFDTLVTSRTLVRARWLLGGDGDMNGRYQTLQRAVGAQSLLTLEAALDLAECMLDVNSVPENDTSHSVSHFLDYVPKPPPPPPHMPGAPSLQSLQAAAMMLAQAYDELRSWFDSHGGSSLGHPLVLRAMTLQGRAAMVRGDTVAALDTFQHAASEAMAEHGPQHVDAQLPNIALAEMLTRQGRGAEALSLLDRALPIIYETYGQGSLAGARVELLYAQACMAPMLAYSYRAEDYARAEPHFARALAAFERELGAEHAFAQAARKGVDACKMALR